MVTKRGARRQQLRAQLWDLGNSCEYPRCTAPATQMAHLHSIGMGGRVSADTLDNVMRACADHAFVTDGAVPGTRGRVWYDEQLALLDLVSVSAWNVAEALRVHMTKHRHG